MTKFDAPGEHCGVTSHGSSTMTNAPIHNTVSVRQLLVKKQITALDHPPYSPDLAWCDFWLFHRLKIVIKGTHFSSSEEITASVTKELKSLKQEEFSKRASTDGRIECRSALTQRGSTLKRTICNLPKNVVLKLL